MNTTKLDIENKWVEGLSNGDMDAFQNIFNKYHARLLSLSMKILKDEALAHDAVQRFFVRLWEKRAGVKITDSLTGYLLGGVKNQCLEVLRKEKTRASNEQNYAQGVQDGENSNSVFDSQSFVTILKEGLEELPSRSREVFTLCKREGLSQQEAADHLGIAVKSVANHMGIAVNKLRAYFKENNLKKELFY